MTPELCVYLDGVAVGTLSQNSGGAITFDYDEEYRADDDATPLSLSMPLVRRSHKNRAARSFLQGLLPDSMGRLEELGREHRISPNNRPCTT